MASLREEFETAESGPGGTLKKSAESKHFLSVEEGTRGASLGEKFETAEPVPRGASKRSAG